MIEQPYNHEWIIVVKSDTLSGAMDAVWQCWEAWQKGLEPMSGANPGGHMGNRMTYDVEKKLNDAE